ncbi:MAG: DUF2203 family protein [Chloroflexi bacterium]|nr:MAG: DUF2203 family protein [Chloroflexota bacterium]
MPTFSRTQAEAILPKVRPLLEDLQRRKAAYDRRATDPVAQEINALLLEIARLGAEVKDPDRGLIDFRTTRRGVRDLSQSRPWTTTCSPGPRDSSTARAGRPRRSAASRRGSTRPVTMGCPRSS